MRSLLLLLAFSSPSLGRRAIPRRRANPPPAPLSPDHPSPDVNLNVDLPPPGSKPPQQPNTCSRMSSDDTCPMFVGGRPGRYTSILGVTKREVTDLALQGNIRAADISECVKEGPTATGKTCLSYSANGKPAMIRSIFPMMPKVSEATNTTKYVEIVLGNPNDELSGREGGAVIAFGLIPEGHVAGDLPGLTDRSWAIHLDDGRCYNHFTYKSCFSAPVRPGDTVGLGVDVYHRRMFFTLNGVHQGVPFHSSAFFSSVEEDLYLAVSVAREDKHILVNTGPYFNYDQATKLNGFGKANQIFLRFDNDKDGYLQHVELKNIIKFTSNSVDSFSYSNFRRFCHITSSNPAKGMTPNAFYLLYEMRFGNIAEDYRILTTEPTNTAHKPISPTDLMNAKLYAKEDVTIHGAWSDWGECTRACGAEGVRKRTCTEPAPRGRGKPCEGPSIQTCNRFVCYENAVWTEWSECSTTCGAGVQFRTCLTDSLSVCEGNSVRPCKNRYPCSPTDYVHVDELYYKPERPRTQIKLNMVTAIPRIPLG
uniref:Calmodulin n=1 Tax=Amorphochlora amoebiformis TaxID=1561963 RepID=A0A7S0DHA2_9EUKA|mmetsp:Transcript_2814/g.4265  ORF Transcript_2814/g.4265 Transcript_2814/m.4265 type:complete len:536 (+) Transcript_2814:43-1650(+)